MPHTGEVLPQIVSEATRPHSSRENRRVIDCGGITMVCTGRKPNFLFPPNCGEVGDVVRTEVIVSFREKIALSVVKTTTEAKRREIGRAVKKVN